jgi:hypothetical protein
MASKYKAVAGEGRDLRHGCAGDRQPNHRRSPEIVKREAAGAGLGAGLGPEVRKPSDVQGKPRVFVRMSGSVGFFCCGRLVHV